MGAYFRSAIEWEVKKGVRVPLEIHSGSGVSLGHESGTGEVELHPFCHVPLEDGMIWKPGGTVVFEPPTPPLDWGGCDPEGFGVAAWRSLSSQRFLAMPARATAEHLHRAYAVANLQFGEAYNGDGGYVPSPARLQKLLDTEDCCDCLIPSGMVWIRNKGFFLHERIWRQLGPWQVWHEEGGELGLCPPQFADWPSAAAKAAEWNRDFAGHEVRLADITDETDGSATTPDQWQEALEDCARWHREARGND